ncbi:hypothetical protein M885DRAFT_530981 [Pelagophyceae sp. CCMP2097]|nr:hypothetical protein M885DRAFT_530981 [Pelagophyceae sp. CCMP2097]
MRKVQSALHAQGAFVAGNLGAAASGAQGVAAAQSARVVTLSTDLGAAAADVRAALAVDLATAAAGLRAADPAASRAWFLAKHPIARLSTAVLLLWLNLFVYYGDPATYSNALSYGTFVGDLYHGLFQPDAPKFVALRLGVVATGVALGVLVGLVAQRLLRDWGKLTFFGFDNGLHADRDALAHQDGAAFCVLFAASFSVWGGLAAYSSVLVAARENGHRATASMVGLQYDSYNLITAGLFAFGSDAWNVATIVDGLAQEISAPEGNATRMLYATPRARRLAAWFARRRLLYTRFFLALAWGGGGGLMFSEFRRVRAILDGAAEPGRFVRPALMFWATAVNTEKLRMLVGCVVALLNICIVMQDWDFPDFSGADVKIAAFDFSALRLPRFCALPAIYISGKWCSYLNVILGVAFDWGYWYLTARLFRPCDYALLWDPGNERMYSLTKAVALEDKYHGGDEAKDCSWFTDNALLALADASGARENATRSAHAGVVRLETGVFTGIYVVDENDVGRISSGARQMNSMCLIPAAGLALFAWILYTHEKVHCFNREAARELLQRLPRHERFDHFRNAANALRRGGRRVAPEGRAAEGPGGGRAKGETVFVACGRADDVLTGVVAIAEPISPGRPARRGSDVKGEAGKPDSTRLESM